MWLMKGPIHDDPALIEHDARRLKALMGPAALGECQAALRVSSPGRRVTLRDLCQALRQAH